MKPLFRFFKKFFIFIFGFGSLLILVSCGDFRGASQPYTYAPETAQSLWIPPKILRKEPVEKFDESEAQALEGKTLTLAEVIDIALINNPDTKKSWANAREMAAKYGQALQKYFVLSNIDANYFRERAALFELDERNIFYETYYGGEIDLSYTILDFGQTRATSKAALQALYAADLSHNRELQTVVKDVMNDYYDYLSQKAAVKAAEQNVANAQVALDAVNERFDSGVADMSDKVQATTKLLQQKLDLVNNKKLLASKYTKFVKKMGLNANAPLEFEDYPKELKLYDLDFLTNLINLAEKNRPDLKASESLVRSAQQKLKLALAKRYPTVDGTFNFGRKYTNLTLGDHYDFKGEISFNYPLFQGFFIENEIKKARAELVKAESELKEKQLALIQEVSEYSDDVHYSKEAYLYAKEFLQSAQVDFDINLQEYKAGTATIVELINAETAVADANYKFINSEKNWYTSLSNIAYATGVLTNDPFENVESQEVLTNTTCFSSEDEKY